MQFERWALDEVTDTTATLLRSRWMPGLAALLPASLSLGEDAQPAAAGLWSEEVDSVLDRAQLEGFIQTAIRETAGQEPRDLREGDVFSVESDEALPLDGLRRPEQTEEFVAICRRRIKKISDATAEQRQLTSVAYKQVLEQALPSSEASLS